MYAIKQRGSVKIGTTNDMVQRLHGLRQTYGTDFKLIAMWHGGSDVERDYHEALAPWRSERRDGREWFDLPVEIEQSIRRAHYMELLRFIGSCRSAVLDDH